MLSPPTMLYEHDLAAIDTFPEKIILRKKENKVIWSSREAVLKIHGSHDATVSTRSKKIDDLRDVFNNMVEDGHLKGQVSIVEVAEFSHFLELGWDERSVKAAVAAVQTCVFCWDIRVLHFETFQRIILAETERVPDAEFSHMCSNFIFVQNSPPWRKTLINQVFQKLDCDGNESIDRDEFETFCNYMNQPMDSDCDGTVSKAEFMVTPEFHSWSPSWSPSCGL